MTTPSKLSMGVVEKLIKFLKSMNANITGIIENMVMTESNIVEEFARKNKVRYLGKILYDSELESCIGSIECLLKTKFIQNLLEILEYMKSLSC